MTTVPPPRAQLFPTCLVNDFLPGAAIAAVELLERAGFSVEVPAGQTCCGQPAFNGGFLDEARAVARHAIGVLERSDAPIVIPSGSCADMLVHQTGELFRGDEAMLARARAVARRSFELTQFLGMNATTRQEQRPPPSRDEALEAADPASGRSGRRRVAYHPSCHLARGLGVTAEPKTLLAGVAGIELVPLAADDECCGFGGMFSVKEPEISGAMLDRKCRAIEASGAEVVASCDAGCLLHLAGGLARRGSPVRACHVAELLAGRAP